MGPGHGLVYPTGGWVTFDNSSSHRGNLGWRAGSFRPGHPALAAPAFGGGPSWPRGGLHEPALHPKFPLWK